MNSNYLGIILGGIVPAIIFGIGGIFIKAGIRQGISLNYFTMFAGIGVVVVSLLSFFVFKDKIVSIHSGTNAFLVGATWMGAILLVSFSLMKFNTPMSIISPLNCTACLVTVILALFIFSEWKETHTVRLLLGTILIIIGAMLVSTSTNESKSQNTNITENKIQSEK